MQIILARYHNHLKAHLVLNGLHTAGIQAFLNNETITDLLPWGEGGYIIRIYESDRAEALNIIREIEDNFQNKNQDFSEADQDEIAYEKLKHERNLNRPKTHYWVYLVVVVIILLYVLRGRIL